MRRIIATTFLGATLASPMALAGPDMDPIFNVTPIAGQPAQNVAILDAAGEGPLRVDVARQLAHHLPRHVPRGRDSARSW